MGTLIVLIFLWVLIYSLLYPIKEGEVYIDIHGNLVKVVDIYHTTITVFPVEIINGTIKEINSPYQISWITFKVKYFKWIFRAE